ncbi:pectate lyase superfamily protein-domain-containing protein [Cercophora scortea]|uniref:Pectate lyase superfamily protein-domain-containing protein n=1 Tax=Cercophora scortea TaxID=314031 RepID=A0AAE0IGN1_9PEZI|nr:pectate lyase superfamily protein-domain-containing protein [Cercophora scortea]
MIDDFVESWKLDDPTGSTSAGDFAAITETANKLKEVLLNPATASTSAIKRDSPNPPAPHPHRSPSFRRVTNSTLPYGTGANSTLEEARALIRKAQKEANIRNRERIANPRRNTYYARLSGKAAIRARAEDVQRFVVNETIAAAAALVAEADAVNATETDYSRFRATGTYWVEQMPHMGQIPYGGAANNNYKVFRNVKDYGAVGDGKTDDTAAINLAISDGGRCGPNCGSSSIKGALVYFPAGTYLISSPILMYYHTQMVGNPNAIPILKAAKSFVGLGLISSDVYTGLNNGQDEWFINQNNFFRQVRNMLIDVSGADMADTAGIHCSTAKSHMGIFAENGSGGFMSDLYFFYGAIGMRYGNQQFTTRHLVFSNCRTAIDMLWD